MQKLLQVNKHTRYKVHIIKVHNIVILSTAVSSQLGFTFCALIINRAPRLVVNINYVLLYHGAWAIAMVTFDVPREIYTHNMPVDRCLATKSSNCIFTVLIVNTNWYSTMVST